MTKTLGKAVADRLGQPAKPLTPAEQDAAMAERLATNAAALVDDPFRPGAKCRPTEAKTHPANRLAAAFTRALTPKGQAS